MLHLTLPPCWLHRHLLQTDSTMLYLRQAPEEEGVGRFFLVTADHQTAGRGQRGNHWEAEAGQNLLFGIRFQPQGIPAARQFVLSEAQAMAVLRALWAIGIEARVKWPNDIYVGDAKLGGMLLEHDLCGAHIRTTITGVGLNVNQRRFLSDAPNPGSLCQLLERDVPRGPLMSAIAEAFADEIRLLAADGGRDLHRRYMAALYRRTGLHPFTDAAGSFTARIADVAPDGRLHLIDSDGRDRHYWFKEVQFVIPAL